MSAIRVSVTLSCLSLLLAATALAAQTAPATPQSPGMSMVRIVRLSAINGSVQMDHGVSRGFEPAIVNLPIVEHTSLRTEAGTAEVEFEDNSTLRLAPQSEVEFPELERSAAGATVSAVRLVRGTAYVSLLKTPGNQFTLLFGQQKVPLQPATHIRLQMTGSGATLAVLDGAVHLDGPDGGLDVPKRRTIAFSLDTGEPTVTKNIATESFDSWDKQSADYHTRVATLGLLGNSPYSYGSNDLSYYGAFSDAGGCGMMWQPYFAGAAWSPYANGTWAWYQGVGYSWVSPYPWGWMPYHYGSWGFCPGSGWGWMPGGAWNGLANMGIATATPTWGVLPKTKILPHAPTNPPGSGAASLVQVNERPLVISNLGPNHSFIFRRDSAGLGVPREELGNLAHFSHNTLQHGTASTPVYMTVAPSAVAAARFESRTGPGASAGLTPMVMNRGSAPTESSSSFSSLSQLSAASSISASSPSSLSTMSTATGGASHGGGGAAGGGGGAHGH